MTNLSFILAYLATGATIAVLAPVVDINQVTTICPGTRDNKLQFLLAMVVIFIFVGSIVVTALLWPVLIALAIRYEKQGNDQ